MGFFDYRERRRESLKVRVLTHVVLVTALWASTAALAYGYSLTEANALKSKQDWNGLLKYAEAWTKAEPNNSNAWGFVGVAYYDGMHRPDLALEPTKRYVALAPQEPSGWTGLGWIYMDLKRYPEAVDAYKHAVQLGPHNGNHWNNLATAYSAEGNCVMQLQTLETQRQIAGSYQDYVVWYNLGNGLNTTAASIHLGANAGKSADAVLREAIYAYQQSLRQNPRYGNAWNNLGIAQEALGNNQEALNDYQRASSFGDSLGRKNYIGLQNQIAARNAAAAAGRPQDNTPGWVHAQQRAQWDTAHGSTGGSWGHQ